MNVLQVLAIYTIFTKTAGRPNACGDVIEWDKLKLREDRSAEGQLWPAENGTVVVPFVISPALRNKTADIRGAFELISQKTCVVFKERTTDTDYLEFVIGDGCASFVGHCGGRQPVFIGKKCATGNICHELLHALGFYHEHVRSDRDDYITVQYQNIKPGRKEEFFKKDINGKDLPYDLNSIMHYGSYEFSANGQPTIVVKKKGAVIGQRKSLSDLDVQRLQKLYACDKH
ncbi:astacin-like metalloendopeptidase [Brienomyrus brachyistius]|uniref:astacin-like metalloendopeptidase n=1 Tax=Brienomyrus brachyistius TaxID=42636 RepID=UPI0020B27E90|nr:astacin-like metalloendopeptidase [Brienomyrus brachyistius]